MYLLLKKFEDLQPENLRIGVPKNIENGLSTGIRYKDPTDKQKKPLYFQSSATHLGHFEWNREIEKKNGKAYIDLYIPRTPSGNSFLELVNKIDIEIIKKIYENRTQWGFTEETSLIEIETKFIPTVSISSIDSQRRSLKFLVPIKHYESGGQYLELELWDQDNEEVPTSMIKPELISKALVYFKALEKDGNYFRLVWELKQLKVKIPEQVFDSCQLSVSDPEEVTYIEDDLYPPWEAEYIEDA